MTTERALLEEAYLAEEVLETVIPRRQMRDLGLTVLSIRHRARQMARAGDLVASMTQKQIRDAILDDLLFDDPRDFDHLGAPDWDAIIAFIEKLLPLILKIIALFGL